MILIHEFALFVVQFDVFDNNIKPQLIKYNVLSETRFAISQTMADQVEEYMNSIGIGCEIKQARCWHDHDLLGCEHENHGCNDECGGLGFIIRACSCGEESCYFYECQQASQEEEE